MFISHFHIFIFLLLNKDHEIQQRPAFVRQGAMGRVSSPVSRRKASLCLTFRQRLIRWLIQGGAPQL